MAQHFRARTASAILFAALSWSCVPPQPPPAAPDAGSTTAVAPLATAADASSPTAEPSEPAKAVVNLESAPAPAGIQPSGEPQKKLETALDQHLKGHASRRFYLQLDKPLYQPGETMWVRATEVDTAALTGLKGESAVIFQLINPKGATIQSKQFASKEGLAAADFDLPAEIEGGEYTLKVISVRGGQDERKFIVNTYEAPRFKKTLEFVRKAYGPGDEVSATIEVKRPTGEPFAARELTGVLTLDGAELPRVKVKTDEKGAGLVKIKLPQAIEKGDGILSVMVEDSGITESVTKRVPIVLNRLKISFFPEGGDLVASLPSRVYFSAQNLIDKPADVEGKIVDDHGQTMATFTSLHDGMGRFELTPATGRTYKVAITKPVGISEQFSLPMAQEQGCTLRTFDDAKGEEKAIRAAVHCTEARTVVVEAMLRERRVGTATAKVDPGTPAVVHFAFPDPTAQGVARVTLFTDTLEPLAERLVFRGWNKNLKVSVKADRSTYVPRGEVNLDVETTDLSGKPVSAELAMAVVDDTVLSFADDKTAHLLAHLFLEPEVPGKVEEPNFYFKQDKPEAPMAMEMLLGTRGWRRFEWQQVFAPPPPRPSEVASALAGAGGMRDGKMRFRGDLEEKAAPMDFAVKRKAPRAEMEPPPAPAMPPMAAPKPAAAPMRGPIGNLAKADKQMAMGMAMPKQAGAAMRAEPMPMERAEMKKEIARKPRLQQAFAADADEMGGDMPMAAAPPPVEWVKARVFPVPSYAAAYDGPRTDFRETIYWNSSVKTGADGKTKVRFYVSDAITSFKVTSEGLSTTGLAGRDETVIQSKLPFFMEVKLPLEVSAGDVMNLPLTLKNEQGGPLKVAVQSSFGSQLKLMEQVAPGEIELAAENGKTLTYPLEVKGSGPTEISFAAQAQGLKDDLKRTLKVVPLGFPRSEAFSGTLEKQAKKTLWLKGALEGSITAKATFYPSPLASMLTGLESIMQEPYGCFEQASSSNYPNIMVLRYLQEHDAAEPAILTRASGLLDRGYKKIAAYESPSKGYEWFGGNPGHEALTAYGLMEFADMRGVYGNVNEEMIQRTARWLLSRRDGKGGFARNPQALDSFGGASEEVTNAYVVWSLTEAGQKDLGPELAKVTANALVSGDAYVIALAAKAQLNVNPSGSDAQVLVKKLTGLQKSDGSFHGTTHSITRSGGKALDVETTSLSILALLSAKGQEAAVRSAVQWLASARDAFGGYGNTQATILSLKALTAYDKASRQMPAGGEIAVYVKGKEVGKVRFEKGRKDPIVLDDLGKYFGEGENPVELKLTSTLSLPFTLSMEYRSNDPASSPDVPLKLTTVAAKDAAKMGETLRVTAKVENTRDQGLPMTLVRVGIPGGLSYQTWQLKELVEKKAIDFFETREREVIVYFRALPPKAVKEIALDLVANVPGSYTAPASSAYLYYTAEQKVWAPPLKARIDRI